MIDYLLKQQTEVELEAMLTRFSHVSRFACRHAGLSGKSGCFARQWQTGSQFNHRKSAEGFMKRLKRLMTVLFATALILVCHTHWTAAGVFIGGKSTPTPAVWADTSQVDEISTGVPGVLHEVVIIWVVQVEGQLYVVGSKDSGWVKRMSRCLWKCVLKTAGTR